MIEAVAHALSDDVGRQPKLLVADLLCGAGGSSTGAEQAIRRLGREMDLVCLNHWPIAIDTHTQNHPKARHYCQDIATVRPHLIVPEGYLDLLMASPTCTHHSVARGGKPTSDQQRSDPWHIITWLTELQVRRMIIENVWEFVKWGPVDAATGRPIKGREGEYFNAWIDTIRKLGATSIEYKKLNAADYGAATTRQRFFGFFRFDRKPLLWPAVTHAKLPKEGAALKRWKAARYIIDWRIKGRSIFGRPVPLAPKTLARILAGARKFNWPDVFIAMLLAEMQRSLAHAIRYSFARRHINRADLRKRHRARVRLYCKWLRDFRSASFGEAPGRDAGAAPMLVTLRNNADGRQIELPIPALAAGGTHIGLAEPVIINGRKGNKAKGVSTEPVPTLDTKGGVWLAEPLILATGQAPARQASDPLPALTTGGAGNEERPGCARPMLVEPFIATVAHGNSARERDPDSRRCQSLDDPLQTLHAGGGKFAMVEPFVLSQASGGSPRETREPLPTAVAGGAIALISPYYGSGSGETCTTVEDSLPTATAKARFGLVVPITHSDGSNRARDVETDPLPTLTTAHRGELAFITAQFGEREGQAPRVHSLERPAPAICATGHVNLVEATGHDILFRMLEAHELAAAMGFKAYKFAGNKTEQIKQIGNAVSVDQMEANVYAMMLDEIDPSLQFLEAAE